MLFDVCYNTDMALNSDWHQENRLTSNASPQERLSWHTAHAEACACRPIPFDVQRLMRAQEQSENVV